MTNQDTPEIKTVKIGKYNYRIIQNENGTKLVSCSDIGKAFWHEFELKNNPINRMKYRAFVDFCRLSGKYAHSIQSVKINGKDEYFVGHPAIPRIIDYARANHKFYQLMSGILKVLWRGNHQ